MQLMLLCNLHVGIDPRQIVMHLIICSHSSHTRQKFDGKSFLGLNSASVGQLKLLIWYWPW